MINYLIQESTITTMGPTEPGSLGIGLGNEDGYVLGRGYASATRSAGYEGGNCGFTRER